MQAQSGIMSGQWRGVPTNDCRVAGGLTGHDRIREGVTATEAVTGNQADKLGIWQSSLSGWDVMTCKYSESV